MMIEGMTWLTWIDTKEVLNSPFTTSLAGALAGAYAGARAAQLIAENSKARDQILAELRSTNSAIMVCFSIFTATLALKRQHVLPMYQAYQEAKAAVAEYRANRMTAPLPKTPLNFTADMKTFPAPVVPIEVLRELLFHKSSAAGRPLALVAVLEQSLIGVESSIRRRDQLIQAFSTGSVSSDLMPLFYFGLPLPSGDVNQEFPDVVEGIASYVDDVAFFSSLLCKDLMLHGEKVRATAKKRLRKNMPRVSSVDFNTPKANGLMPPAANYNDWLGGFQEMPVVLRAGSTE